MFNSYFNFVRNQNCYVTEINLVLGFMLLQIEAPFYFILFFH